MKIQLIKPFKLGEIIKPIGKIMTVTRSLGNDLINEDLAESYPVLKPIKKKPFKIKK